MAQALKINSNPSGARVYLAPIGQGLAFVGTTPFSTINVLPMRYSYRLELAGYPSKEGIVDIYSGLGSELTINLEVEKAYTETTGTLEGMKTLLYVLGGLTLLEGGLKLLSKKK